MHTPKSIEERARKALALVRKKGVLARVSETNVNLEVVEGSARFGDLGKGCILKWKLVLAGQHQAEREEDVLFVTSLDDTPERLDAYVDGWAQAIGALVKRASDVSVLTPSDLCFPEVLDTKAKDPLQFAERILIASEKRADEIQNAIAGTPKPIDDLSATKSVAGVNEDLEEAIRQAPDDRERYLVYADWLSERGDPRGELTVCQARADTDKDEAAKERAVELLAKHRRYFVGNIDDLPEWERRDALNFKWELGWISVARVTHLEGLASNFGRQLLDAVLRFPSTKFLRELILARTSTAKFDPVYDVLTAIGPRPTLRRLELDADEPFSALSAGDLARLKPLYPNLEHLGICAGEMKLGTSVLDYPKLKSLRVATHSHLSKENAAAIVDVCTRHASFFESLEVWLGSREMGSDETDLSIAVLDPLFQTTFPKLRSLALRNTDLGDSICAALVGAPIMKNVKELDFTLGTMTSVGAQSLVEACRGLDQIETVNLRKNYLTKAAIDMLERELRGKTIGTNDQKDWEDDEEDRYITIEE